ncbi:hypothetical protein V2J09_003463 [Rumex salicifolius]
MFSHFGATADTLSKASTMVFRIGTDAHLYDDPDDVDIPSLLDSKFDSDKCEALKRLLALIAQGIDVSNFFPQVVKNVASQSLETKKLVYLYLLHYAEKRPNEALLSINCFQKDLADINPLVRAWALRTMAGIRLHVISPIVLVAVGKCARDPSVYVRKCAANALPKINDLHIEENASAIEEIIGILLNDSSPGVVGAAAASFNSICPNNFSLIGRNFRRLCEALPDVEEWGQIILIGILLRYLVARHGLVKESIMHSFHRTEPSNSNTEGTDNYMEPKEVGETNDIMKSKVVKLVTMSYIEGPDEYLSRSSYTNGGCPRLDSACFTSAESNEDVKIILKSTLPLLWSHNSAVLLAAAGLHWIMAPKDDIKRIVKPLLFVLRSSSASKYVVLCNIQVFAKAMPAIFSAYYEDFFISVSELYQVKALKLEILSSIATESSISHIFQEFQDYIRDPDRRFAADTVAAIGFCAERLPQVANQCLDGLLSLTRQESMMTETSAADGESGVLIQAVMSIQAIIKQDPQTHEKVIIQMARSLDVIRVPAARAIIIWMVGEYSSLGERTARASVVVLKYLVHCFTSEALETKLQVLSTSVKVILHANMEDLPTVKQVSGFLLELAKSDINYDVRDRARILNGLISSFWECQGPESSCITASKELAHLIAEKILGSDKISRCYESFSDRFYLPGSLSQIVLHAAPGYEPLPKPCSLLQTSYAGTVISEDSYETDDGDTSSGSLNEESASDYSSQLSSGSSRSSLDGRESDAANGHNINSAPLIQFSNTIGDVDIKQYEEEVLSTRALETWLGDQSISSEPSSSQRDRLHSSARISIADIASRVKAKSYTLLDTSSGNGLKVDYSFSSEPSYLSSLHVCLEVSFQNTSAEPFSEVLLKNESSNKAGGLSDQESKMTDSSVPTLVPMEEIESLEPGQMTKRIIQVRFLHHLLPLKMVLCCNGKGFPVKLRPDIGYFVKPLPMDVEAFKSKESELPGMFEYTRRCTFTDHMTELSKDETNSSRDRDAYLAICESLALKMLCNANLFLVSMDMPVTSKLDDASGLCLRFTCEILSCSRPCLITITVQGNCSEPLDLSVKVNCEETVFGLNLLNRIVNFLAEPTSP